MEIVFVWLVLAGLVGLFANSRGRSGFGFFLLSAVLSPLLGFVIVLVSKDLNEEAQREAQRKMDEDRKERERKEEHEKQLAALKVMAGGSSHQPGAPGSVAEEIAKLGSLLEKGLLTEEEFRQQKAAVLGRG
jgi:hypothetical protein